MPPPGTCMLTGLLLVGLCSAQATCPPAIQVDKKPQIFVLSDINNEPDDAMSFIRLLVHSDQYNITGMAAVSSYWLNSSVVPEQIQTTVRAYGQVVDNLNKHTAGEFPSEEYLASIVKAGHPVYGTAAIGKSPMSSGASRLIDVIDWQDDGEVLHVQAWGGVNTLAEVLGHVRATRTQYDLDKFINKIRVYTISDQDNAGPWIRANFPTIPYIVSLHAFNQYGLAAWSGISGDLYYGFDVGGPDTSLVTQEYVSKHFQIGPLGEHYPNISFIMEGDSPSLMHTMQNGVNGGPFDHPEWGGWGGRYNLLDPSRQTTVYSDSADTVLGINNKTHVSNQATIWRWRQAFQDEMSARMAWTTAANYSAGSHPPVVSVNGSCGSAPYIVDVDPEATITLDGSGTYDPDANITGKSELQYKWWHYREITAAQANVDAEVPKLNLTLSDNGRVVSLKLPAAELACSAPRALHNEGSGVQDVCQQYHIIFEVTGSGRPSPIRRYKRVILKVQPPSSGENGSTRKRRDEL